tara:strand:+ start:229 stop:1224 length:996 start_codon:yes stop_codon:yes gene_type:complete
MVRLFAGTVCLVCCVILWGCGSSSTDGDKVTQSTDAKKQLFHFDKDGYLDTNNSLQAGDSYVYSYIKGKFINGASQIADPAVNLKIAVLEEDESGYLISWTLQMAEFPADDNSFGARLSRIARVANIVRVSRDFETIELVNADELYEVGIQTANLVADMRGYSLADREPILKMFRDRTFSESMYLKPIQLFFLCMGWELEAGVERVMETELASQWGELLPATLRVRLELDQKQEHMLWEMSTRFENEQLEHAIESYMKSVSVLMAIDMSELSPLEYSVDLHDEVIARFNPSSDFPASVFVERFFEATSAEGNADRLETWSWTLVEHNGRRP